MHFGSRAQVAPIMLAAAVFAAPVLARTTGADDRAAPDVARSVPGQTIAVEATPAWVSVLDVPAATKPRLDRAQSGVAYLLADEQYRTRADGHDDWFRTATRVTNRSGLESTGQISVSFNPAFETVGVDFVHLIRDGKVIDLTRDTQFRVVEREQELDDGIISGTLKAVANLRDVRVGDIVDYATTVHTGTSLWPGQAFYHFSQRYSDAVGLKSLRLVWPAGMSPEVKAFNSDIAFVRRPLPDGGSEWTWHANDPAALDGEKDVPAGAFQWGRVDVSTMHGWTDLSRWASKLYAGDETLPGDFAARLDAIARNSAEPAARLTAATRLVQDNIRYVGEEMGEGSYVPRRPATVLARGYGDCKDKSLLLAVALRRLGIDAVPALVSTTAGDRLPDRLPTPLQFDHVIVRAVLDGKVLWIDATGAHRGGRGTAIVPADFGWALPIRAEQTTLERIEGYAERAGSQNVVEQFTIDEAADQPLTLHVVTRFTDARADRVRANWAGSSATKIAKDNLDFYHRRFAGLVESRRLQLSDDRDANIVTMIEDYTLPRKAWADDKLSATLVTRAYAVQDVLPDRQPRARVLPLAINGYLVNEQTIELHVKDRALDGLDDLEVKRGGMAFSRRTTKLPDGLSMVWRLDTGAHDSVAAAEVETLYALSDQVKDETGIEWHLDKATQAAKAPDGIDPAVWATIKPEMEQAVALMQKEDEASYLQALTLLTGAASKVSRPSPTAGLIDGLKGAVLAGLRRNQAALAALQSATTQYDGNPAVYRLWIGYELDLGTAESVARAMGRTRRAQPSVIAALDQQWVMLALQKVQSLPADKRLAAREDMCMALSDGGWQQAPRTAFGDTMLGCAIAGYSRRGDLAQARAGLAKAPSTDTLLTLSLDRAHQPLWADIDRDGADGFRKPLEAEADRAATAAAAAPKNYDTVTRRMKALRALGRFDQAAATGRALAGDKAQVEIGGRDAFWLVNEYALDLRAAGKLEAAVAAMDGVLSLGLDSYPDLVSLAINRAEMLVAAGRDQDALAALDDLEANHAAGLSGYGRMWVWADRSCALRALGRSKEAALVDAKLAEKPADNWSAATAAAACRDDSAAIADMLVQRLQDEDARPVALGMFVTFGAPEARTPVEVRMRAAVAKARAMPAVQAAFAKVGRSVRYAGTTQGWSEF